MTDTRSLVEYQRIEKIIININKKLMSARNISFVTFLSVIICFLINIRPCYSRENKIWHNIERTVRYHPDGQDFTITNGTKRFNRAIYGTNTGFRIEAGDLPEFALYMPGMGGNLKFGFIAEGKTKWLIEADSITARYRPGSMLYEIKDSIVGDGKILLTILAINTGEGLLIKFENDGSYGPVDLFCFYGGASGKRFHRDGDIGADPESSFYLKPEYCRDNEYTIHDNRFFVTFGQNSRKGIRNLNAIFPPNVRIRTVDAQNQKSPQEFFNSRESEFPALACRLSIENNKESYIAIYNPNSRTAFEYTDIALLFKESERVRIELADRIQVDTPDPYINTLGGALSIAADAIWEYPSYLHGAVAWRSRLHGWRGIYAADPLGWHERAQTHFQAYAKSQYLMPEKGPVVPDPEKNMARQQEKTGTAMFSSGYISRRPGKISSPHHYDMNLIFFDALLRHFNWTGDTDFVKEMWPALKRHLEWEKRCFDGDNDGLYDAYCCIWASDALQYSGGGVTHSSAYNYRANRYAAELAEIIGENPEPFKNEADKILKVIHSDLWMPEKGWFAEYKESLGFKEAHSSAGLWTAYHAIDSDIADPFQAFQITHYVDTQIPHIPIAAIGLPAGEYYTLSTTRWQPYTWSINNVALAEVLHTSLAYWQAGRSEQAFDLWKSALLESMYLGSSPGNFQQLSFYDAMRGELYRDFADPIGVAARTLVEGLFGIKPDALEGILKIKPAFPKGWNNASLIIPDISFNFKRDQNKDTFSIISNFSSSMRLKLQAPAYKDSIISVTVNGQKAIWADRESAVVEPLIEIDCGMATQYIVEIEWFGNEPEKIRIPKLYTKEETFQLSLHYAKIMDFYDPQKVLSNAQVSNNILNANIAAGPGHHSLFVKAKQGQLTWWMPVILKIKNPLEIVALNERNKNNLNFCIHNYASSVINGKLLVNSGKNMFETTLSIQPKSSSGDINVPAEYLVSGSNRIRFEYDDNNVFEQSFINWDIQSKINTKWETIDLSLFFNDKVTNIFKNQYLTPRSPYPTLQLPTQGIGNWCYANVNPIIDDSGLRHLAGDKNQIVLPQGIPFRTSGDKDQKNIIFTSLWDNYPDEIVIPVSGKASHAYFLMAGSTNPMQSQFSNGKIIMEYTDGSMEKLDLRNPESWWPIEQDYINDGYAFSLKAPKPIRVHLKTGLVTRDFDNYVTIKGFTNRAIDGGAATVFDLPLNPNNELKQLKLNTTANEVVIGLMSVTLVRDI